MHFSTISVLAVLSSIARALPQVGTAPTPTPEPITRFTIQVYNTGTALHNKVIHASGRYFSLGLDGPSTFCPLIGGPFEDACPPGDETVVYGGGISLAVVVPGGQQTYVEVDGAVGFTQAHSASTPTDSIQSNGFTEFTFAENTGPITLLQWDIEDVDGLVYSGIYACPIDDPFAPNVTHRIHVNRASAFADLSSDCILLTGIRAVPQPDNEDGAWQYT